ncbi:hypothetical protein HJFPF1_07132 [Paramyrothecium foliicola]|nr:hypothetical protein HJFPF1_07132 [Paramyrothecium foliicola]
MSSPMTPSPGIQRGSPTQAGPGPTIDSASQRQMRHGPPPRQSHSHIKSLQIQPLQSLITGEVQAKLIAALATLRGKKGAPFSFVTSGDVPTFSSVPVQESGPEVTARQQQQPSLRLSWLLKHLASTSASPRRGQTIIDPAEGGIITHPASKALIDYFMLEINAKWEYILDPHVDTYDSVCRRSPIVFVTILFCSSKFTNYVDGALVPTTDPSLQSRLCTLVRKLAVRNFAEGNRSLETMQAFYILACRKEQDDDVSYLHSGYAFRILQDADLEQPDCDDPRAVRLWRTWLGLFRQDKQQSLFFLKRAFFGPGSDGGMSSSSNFKAWLRNSHALPLDSVASCCADLRRIQANMRAIVHKASAAMEPCLLDLMESEWSRWNSTWQESLYGNVDDMRTSGQPVFNGKMLLPGGWRIRTLMKLYESSVRLNVASAIFRQALIASAATLSRFNRESTAPLSLDLPSVVQLLATGVLGLRGSIQGAFGTLAQLSSFPEDDLRRSPDAVLLLGPSAALLLCLLLCLPCRGLLGSAFQKASIGLISDIAQHMSQAVQSPQDIVALHANYLESLIQIMGPAAQASAPEWRNSATSQQAPSSIVPQDGLGQVHHDDGVIEAANVLTSGMAASQGDALDYVDAMFGLSTGQEHDLHWQSLANLLEPDYCSILPLPAELHDSM